MNIGQNANDTKAAMFTTSKPCNNFSSVNTNGHPRMWKLVAVLPTLVGRKDPGLPTEAVFTASAHMADI